MSTSSNRLVKRILDGLYHKIAHQYPKQNQINPVKRKFRSTGPVLVKYMFLM